MTIDVTKVLDRQVDGTRVAGRRSVYVTVRRVGIWSAAVGDHVSRTAAVPGPQQPRGATLCAQRRTSRLSTQLLPGDVSTIQHSVDKGA